MITRITPTLWQVRTFGFVNAWLVAQDDDTLTLVDTLTTRSAPLLQRAAAAAGSTITRVVQTHGHVDHVGSTDALLDELPDRTEFIASTREAPLLAGDMTLQPGEGDTLKGGWTKLEHRPTRTVDDGDRIGSLRVIATPGHSPGHIALLDERDGTLIGGDVFSNTWGFRTTSHVALRFPIVGIATQNPAQELESARRLLSLEPTRLACGHGQVLEQPVQRMADAIAHADERLAA